MESTLYVFVTFCFRLVTIEYMCGFMWLLVCLCVTVSYAIVPYLVDTQECGLHILINTIDIDLKYYLHTSVMRN